MNEPSRPPAPLTALILAGRRPNADDPLADLGAPHKALIEIENLPLIQHVLEALQKTHSVKRILVSAPDDVRPAFAPLLESANRIIPCAFSSAANSPAGSIAAAIKRAPDAGELFVTTCDHPLLSHHMISVFLEGANQANVPAAAACVTENAYNQAYPDTQRTFIRLKDFSFSGANMFYFQGKAALPLVEFWRKMEMNRKRPIKMAAEIGLLTGLSYLAGALTKDAALKRIARKTGVQAELIPVPFAEAAIDVDKPEDIALVKKIFRERALSEHLGDDPGAVPT
ncbi:MAG: nucleotidyltransferase family protein [Pseudomonadota bacterium]